MQDEQPDLTTSVATIIASMRQCPDDAVAAERGCCSLERVAADREGQQAAVDASAPAAIVAAMLAHPGVAGVALWGCRSLGRIAAFFRFGQEDVVKAGALAAIVSAVLTHCAVVDVTQRGCCSLDSITADHPEGQQAAVDAGAPAAIVAAMSAHHSISEHGCRALASVVAFFPAGQQAATSAGAPDAIASAMIRADVAGNADCAGLLQWGCLALGRIAQFVSADTFGPSHQFSEVQAGAAAASLKAAAIGNFVNALRLKLPTALLFYPSSHWQDTHASDVMLSVTVGCDADQQLACDCARMCGLYPLPSFVQISSMPGVVAAAGFSDSLCLVTAQSDATGAEAFRCAVCEISRLLPFVMIEYRKSPPASTSVTGSVLSSLSICTPTTRVVVPFSRGIVANAMLTFLLHRLRAPMLDLSVWCAVEAELALPQPSDPVHVESPVVPPMPSRGILTGSKGNVFLENASRRNPTAGGAATGGLHRVQSSAGAWFGHGRVAYLLTSADMLSSNSVRALSRVDPADAVCEVLSFVGCVDPSFLVGTAPCYHVQSSNTYPSIAANMVADVAVFRAPRKYSAGTVTLRGANFLNSHGLVSLPSDDAGLVSCTLPRGIGYFNVDGTARRFHGHTGYPFEQTFYLAQHTCGVDIEEGDSGAQLSGKYGLHSFVHSQVLAAPFRVCRAALLADDDAVNALLIELAADPRNVYLLLTPATCALAQAASIIGVPLRDLSFTSSPVTSSAGCTVS